MPRKTQLDGWRIELKSPSVVTVDFPRKLRALLISDLHWDNAHCDRETLKRDLQAAKDCGAPIFLFGDTFCAMQGKWDRRKDERQLRPEHRGGNYFDKLVDTAAEWFAPYAANIALITKGNHETSIIQHHETDLVQRLHQALRGVKGYRGHAGAYAGFIALGASDDHRCRRTRSLYWHHGYGGGGEVTRGLIDNSRTRGQVFADIYVSGHVHRRNMDENVVQFLDTRTGQIQHRRQLFLRCSTYKHEDGSKEGDISGWHVEKGRASRPIGGWWLDLTLRNSEGEYEVDISATPTL